VNGALRENDPLLLSAQKGVVDVTAMLLRQCPPFRRYAYLHRVDQDGSTVLHHAIANQQDDVMLVLLNHGAVRVRVLLLVRRI
jgi:ankyrin repeat protein